MTEASEKSATEFLTKLDARSELPSLPQIMVQLNAVALDPNSSAGDLSRVIMADTALTSRVLAVANSTFYAGTKSKNVTTISQAVVNLGFDAVLRLALGMSILSQIAPAPEGEHLMRFWMHTIASAVAASHLATLARVEWAEEAFIAALLHDVGALMLIQYAPQDFEQIGEQVRDGRDPLAAERSTLGFTHLELGEVLCEKWDLPEIFVEAAGRHHEFCAEGKCIQNVMTMACLIATSYCSLYQGQEEESADLTTADIADMVREHLDIEAEDLEHLSTDLGDEVEKWLDLLHVTPRR